MIPKQGGVGMKEITKKSELSKLNKIFKNIEADKKKVVERLIENVAFMGVELNKLQEYISEHGCTENYQNGANQFGKKRSSEFDAYSTLIKNYTTVLKQLIDLLPDGKKEAEDELMSFLKK